MVTRIIKNAIKCLACKTVIESKHRHDFVFCPCKAVAVDGGKEYLRRVGATGGYKDLSKTEDYEDLTDLLDRHGVCMASWGYCQKGWLPIVDKLIKDLKKAGWDCYLGSVGEKYGGLRFSTGGLTEEMEDLIDAAEAKSLKTCELCGKPGKNREKNFWIKTRCKKCEDR